MDGLGSGGILACIITALALSQCAPARGAGRREPQDAALEAMKAGDPGKAAELMKRSVAEAEQLGNESPQLARALAGLVVAPSSR
jgi:hypothetical protein